MFLSAPRNPTKIKHAVYLAAAVVLGLLLSLFVHAGIEAGYLAWAGRAGREIVWYGGCALPPVVRIGLLIMGAIGGLYLGRYWWRLVYIERRWARGLERK
jgi:hypothetical protein